MASVLRRPPHAVIECQPAEENAAKAPLVKIARKPRARAAIVLEECRIGVDLAAKSLADDELGVGNVERWMKCRPLAPLHAMIGPKRLHAVGHSNALERLVPGVGRGEGAMIVGMPVLGQHDV